MPPLDHPELRAKATCPNCRNDKNIGTLLCWLCWREFKSFTGTLEEWIAPQSLMQAIRFNNTPAQLRFEREAKQGEVTRII